MSSVGKVGALTAAAFAGAGLFFVGCKDDKNNPSPSPGPPGPPGPPEKFVCTMNSDCNSRFGYGFGCVGKPGMCVFNQCTYYYSTYSMMDKYDLMFVFR